MTRINCHSAFKYYEMFHASCGGGNYGSVFNTTYNIECGGHGGFWGGVGYGLGNAFGNLFGGWLGGGMNFGLGGFSNFGFPSFSSGWSNWGNWGNWGNKTTNCNCNCKGTKETKETGKTKDGVNDKDNPLIENYKKEIENLKPDASEELQKNLYNRIKAKLDKPEDSVYEEQNKLAYKELLDMLKEKYPKTEFESGSTGKPQVGVVDPNAGAQAPAAAPAPTAAAAAGSNKEKIAAAESFDDLPEYNKLTTKEEKNDYFNKCKELAEAATPEDLRKALDRMPDGVRAKVKASFYKSGYQNVKAEDITEDLLKNLIEVIDDSDIADFKNITVGTPTKSGDLWTIPMTSPKSINYIQVSVDPIDGEIIFHGYQEDQQYVLQKDSDGKLHFMQYKYHKGYGTGDVS